MNTDFTIRIAQPADVLELKDLFQDTVLNINRRDYSKAEVEDWGIVRKRYLPYKRND